MFSRIIVTCLIFMSFSVTVMSASSTNTNLYKAIVKIKNYEYNPYTDSFSTKSYGSAVFVGQGKLITNAHVILDKDNINPTGLYQICYSVDTKNVPVCTANAKLKAFDTVADLALLEIVNPKGITPVKISKQEDIDLGSNVVMYGYPAIGGDTITRTEGKIAGTYGDMYKVDGTIDHGNSGGGAFDKDGNLIGIPTAVASDNGVIGYMVPAKTVNDFLAGKTDNYTLYTQKMNAEFSVYASKLQSIYKNTKSIKDDPIMIGDSTKYGFNLVDIAKAKDAGTFMYQYSEKTGRVNLYIACSKDAGLIESWVAKGQGIKLEKELNKDYIISDEWIGAAKNIYAVTYSPVKVDNSVKKQYKKVLYYKNYDACYANIVSDDIDKDKNTIAKAIDFASYGVSFSKKFVLDTKFDSPFMKVVLADPFVRLSSYFTANGERSMSVSFELNDKRWIDGDLTITETKKAEDLFGIDDFKNLSKFSGPYTLENFSSRVGQVIKNNATYVTYSKNRKPFIFSRYQQWSDNNTAIINVIYPYKLSDGHFAVLDWNFEYTTESTKEFDDLEKFFNSIDLPGTPAFPVQN